MLTFTLASKLLLPHRLLQHIASQSVRSTVKRGHQGPHVMALQQGLNYVFQRSRVRGLPKRWGMLKLDGKFGENTFAAVKGFQEFYNRRNRIDAQDFASGYGDAPKTRTYKKFYADVRHRIACDGIIGAETLLQIDSYLIYRVR